MFHRAPGVTKSFPKGMVPWYLGNLSTQVSIHMILGHLLWPLGTAAYPGTLLQMVFTPSTPPPFSMGQFLLLWLLSQLGMAGEMGPCPPSPSWKGSAPCAASPRPKCLQAHTSC